MDTGLDHSVDLPRLSFLSVSALLPWVSARQVVAAGNSDVLAMDDDLLDLFVGNHLCTYTTESRVKNVENSLRFYFPFYVQYYRHGPIITNIPGLRSSGQRFLFGRRWRQVGRRARRLRPAVNET